MKYEFDRPRRKAVALDPHPLCHTALSTLLARFDIDLVAAATTTGTAETLLQEHQPDLLVMEVNVPEGLDAALSVISSGRDRVPELTVIVLSGTDDRTVIDAAFDCGAAAYVLKTSDPEAIATAIRQAFEPSLYLARPQKQRRPCGRQGRPAEADPARARDPAARLGRTVEPSGGGDPLGRRPDGEVPPREHLPQAQRPQPLRSGPLGA